MIKVILNATLLDEKITGIGQYQYNVIKKLSQKKDILIKVVLNGKFVGTKSGINLINNLKKNNSKIEIIVAPSNKSMYRFKSLVGKYLRKGYIYHDLSFNSALGKDSPKVVTFHDAFFLDKNLNRKKFGFSNLNARFVLPWSAKNADHIIVHTNVVKEKLMNGLGISNSKISVFPMGNPAEDDLLVPEYPNKTGQELIINGNLVKKPYFLAVGAGHVRKRTKDLILASMNITESHNLVITGKNAIEEPEVKKLMHKNKNVMLLNYVSREDLIILYRNASGFFFPSSEEGFGFPIIEALKYNVPVFASNIPVFKEIGSHFINYFEVGDIDKIAYYMENIIKEKIKNNDREKVQDWLKKYTWDNYVDQLIELYKQY